MATALIAAGQVQGMQHQQGQDVQAWDSLGKIIIIVLR